ncbi:MAG: biotin carboxylase N-terminal domain-containing protein, partial [Pseudomonadota bacterium]
MRRLLIANRGEIAARIARTARGLGIETVAVYSDADAGAVHVRSCDQAVRIGPAPVSESYLRADALLEAARATGADAIHPGYGFLSENPDFAEAVAAAGLAWVGPPATAIRAMGLKDEAKRRMEAAGVPVTPGYHGDTQDPAFLAERAAEIGYPVLIKASAGGGGKGMRLVETPDAFAEALARAQSEAASAFGNDRVLIEKFIQNPRHIEVQVFADSHGSTVHLFERDCSAQRRHQKVIEEAPAPGMTEALRAAMTGAAVRAAEAVGYVGAGTVEFIVDGSRMTPDAFYFMEMNTRLQVEHPVTEAVTGTDLVAWQLAVASGAPLPLGQDQIRLSGHAVEARLYAEDPAHDFRPQTGRLTALRLSEAVRVDTGVTEGDTVTPHYDPMIAKLIAHGPDREAAFARLGAALAESQLAGLTSNLGFLARLVADAEMRAGRLDTGLIARQGDSLLADP